jgi:hypothetical protein
LFIDWDGDGEVSEEEFVLSDLVLFDDDEKQKTEKQPPGCGCATALGTIVLIAGVIAPFIVVS